MFVSDEGGSHRPKIMDFEKLGIWSQNEPVGPRGNPGPFFWLKFDLESNSPNPKF